MQFFKGKDQRFTSYIVHELKPVTLKQSEVFYQIGDEANDIYFISTGRIKLIVDLHEFIYDQDLLKKIKDLEEK